VTCPSAPAPYFRILFKICDLLNLLAAAIQFVELKTGVCVMTIEQASKAGRVTILLWYDHGAHITGEMLELVEP
jgi:hypothetical protein